MLFIELDKSIQHSPSNTTTSQTSSPSSSNGSSPDHNPNHGGHRRSSSPAAALVGGIIGGVVVVVVVILVIFLIRRRRIRKRGPSARLSIDEASVSYAADPFRSPRSSTDQLSPASAATSHQSLRQVAGPTVVTLSYDPATGASQNVIASNATTGTQVVFNGDSKRGELSPPAAPSSSSSTNNPPTEADLPGLIERLNIIMAHLPPGGTREEELPEYEPV